jgi:polyisoprenoid-binding protein YceI
MKTAVQPIVGKYELDPVHSSVGFAVTHMQISTFRASFVDVGGLLVADDEVVTLTASARADSVSIGEPPELRDHVVRSDDFFAADEHPVMTFESSKVALHEDGRATVAGELTVRGVTATIDAGGSYRGPIDDPFGGQRIALALRGTVDRRAWDMSWQRPLPDGADALGWQVELSADLELVRVKE